MVDSIPCLSPKNPCRKGFMILHIEQGQNEVICPECGTEHELVDGQWRRKKE